MRGRPRERGVPLILCGHVDTMIRKAGVEFPLPEQKVVRFHIELARCGIVGLIPSMRVEHCPAMIAADPPNDVANSPAAERASLSLEETLRVMDVARQLRQSRETVTAELNLDETKAALRERLKSTAAITGESATEAEIAVAVELYFNNLHSYRDPPPSWSKWLALCYVRRHAIAARGSLAIIGVALIWGAARWWRWI